MKFCVLALFALTLAGCAPLSVSQSLAVKSALNERTVGGAGYPIVIEGAESIGLNPTIIAQNLRFPATLNPASSFRAVTRAEAPRVHARLSIAPGQPLAPANLAFVQGDRTIGTGTFSIRESAYRDPQALGSVSAILISDMLNEAQEGIEGSLFFPRRYY